MNQSKSIFLVLAIAIIGLNACKKSEDTPKPSDPPVNETELITTIKMFFTDTANTNDIRTAYFYDIDGPGGNPPSTLDTIDLSPNKVYTMEIFLLDDTKNPADSISNQVLKEGTDHLFVYTKSGVNLTVTILDKDKNNLPLGLNSLWQTRANSNGSVTVTLRHQPGVKNGTAAPGVTDVEVVFPCRIR